MGPEHYYAVIMAGGGGTRLWPLSRPAIPSRCCGSGGERTLFQQAVDRLQGMYFHRTEPWWLQFIPRLLH